MKKGKFQARLNVNGKDVITEADSAVEALRLLSAQLVSAKIISIEFVA